jgi:FkbM family methyltransferase
MTVRNAFRDFFRRRRLARHRWRHGDRFLYHGLEVRVPEQAGLGVANALLRGKYERDEATMIMKHLPADLPVIELGGSLGVISRLIRSRLGAEVPHLVVEANPDLIETCRFNAAQGAAPGRTIVVNAAIYHDGPLARFRVGRDIHSNALAGREPDAGRVIEAKAVTLADLHRQLGAPAEVVLVSDIEGAEYAVFERESAILAHLRLAIVEIHPGVFAGMGASEADFLALAATAGLVPVDRQGDVIVLAR